MDQVLKQDRQAEEVTRIREIVARHPTPGFITGFEVYLGDFDGDPAVWIVYQVTGDPEPTKAAVLQRGDDLYKLVHGVRQDILESAGERFPYFSFGNPQAGSSFI